MFVGAGCAKSTEILVVLTSDLDLPSQANALTLVAAREENGALLFGKTYSIPSETLLPASLDLRGSSGAPWMSWATS